MKTKNKSSIDPMTPPFKEIKREKSGNQTWLPSDYSPPTLRVEGVNDKNNLTISCDFSLTVRIKIKEFTRKQACLLVGQSLYLVAKEGLNISDWMVLEYLYNYLIGQKQSYEELTEFSEFYLTLLLKIVLTSVDVSGLLVKVQIPEDLQKAIFNSKFVPNKRTFHSREASYRLNKFLSIRSVPTDHLLERSNDSERYSGYCKGYGESSSTGHRLKTRPSAELDGETVSLESKKFRNFKLTDLTNLFDLTMLEAKYRYFKLKY